jgi:hypothetical protein
MVEVNTSFKTCKIQGAEIIGPGKIRPIHHSAIPLTILDKETVSKAQHCFPYIVLTVFDFMLHCHFPKL